MRDVPVGVSDAQFVVRNDEDKPFAVVVDLVRSVLGRSETEAFALLATIEQQGRAVCGGRLNVGLRGGADGLSHAVR
jgi:ATP-dependent Clp protease adaptor protein ClpS